VVAKNTGDVTIQRMAGHKEVLGPVLLTMSRIITSRRMVIMT
jgi:hypothetical protein